MGEYTNHSVVIHTIDTGTAVGLGGISSTSANPNISTVSDQGGQLHDTSRSVSRVEPTQEFTTTSVPQLLGAIGADGSCLNTDGTHPGADIYFEQKKLCGGAAVGASDHARFRYANGLITPVSLSASGRDADVTLSAMIDALTDGTNEPLARDHAVALPTGIDKSQYVLGAAKSRDVLLTDIRSFELAFNIEKGEKRPELAGVYPDTIPVQKARPAATISAKTVKLLRDTTTVDDATAFPLSGSAAEHADTVFYFRKRKNRVALEDNASTVHFSITIAGLLVPDNLFSASGVATGDTAWKIEAIHDGTNAPVILTPNIAYNPSP